ncbi:MAG: apolipoprotein N-acyltransferase [Verrucomicrobiota bacterium]
MFLAISFPKFNLWGLAWLAPGLMLSTAVGKPGKIAFGLGFVAGLGHYLCSLYWLLLIPLRWHGVVAWLSLSIYMALFPAAWCWVCWRCYPKVKCLSRSGKIESGATHPFISTSQFQRIRWAVFCGAAWVAMELGIARIFTGFPWNLLGVSQYKLLPLIQIASVTGVYGVSFMVVWTSVAMACAVLMARHTRSTFSMFARELAAPFLGLATIIVFGYIKLSVPDFTGARLKVALIQPGIPQSVIWDANERTNRLHKLVELSNAALAERPDLLVWPEAALPPGMVGRTRDTQQLVTELVRSNQVWMVFGVIDTVGASNKIELNSAFFIDPNGDLISRYHKRRLVIFGEYMPGVQWLPFLKKLRAGGAGLGQGRVIVPFQMRQPRARIAPLICFEDVFPHLTRDSVDSETDFLLNLTNNGWFGKSAAQWQHAISALFRAIENGLPLVRCTNNGLTCWIDSGGRMHDVYFQGSTDIYEAGFKIVEIPLRSSIEKEHAQTIYNRYGDFFSWACAAITFAITAGSLRLPRSKK